jgi:pimeloyl-ACP methyl ester carboxylesterase
VKRALVAVGLVCSCGDNFHPPELAMHIAETPPAYGEAPFPTDAVREGQTLGVIKGLDQIVGAHDDLIAAHLAQLTGWGLRPAIEFFIEGPIDPTTVPTQTHLMTDPLVVLDVDPNTPEHDSPILFDWRYDDTRHVITGSPANGVNLRDGVKYAGFITKDIKGIDGETLVPGQALEKLTHSPPVRWQSTADAYALLTQNADLKERIVGLTVFTTQQVTSALVHGREADANTSQVPAPAVMFPDASIIFDTPARLDALLGQAQRDSSGPRDGLEQWGLDNPTGIAHDHVAVVASGTMQVGIFRRPDTGTDGPEDETFEIGAYGVPNLVKVDTIPVTFILPKGPMPANGFPTVIFGHGLGGSRHDALNLAEPLCSKGFAVVAIDMWGHGSRYNPTDDLNNLSSKTQFTGDPTLHDGFGDPESAASELDFFENFLNIGAIRDTIRQSALDEARLAMLIQAKPDLGALAGPYGSTPKLDTNHVAYLGESFGTIVGTLLAAIEPSIDLYVLDVPGGGLLDQIVPNSAEIGSLALPYAQTIYRPQGALDRFHPAFSMMQAIIEAGDSLAYAPHILRNRLTVDDSVLGKRNIVLLQAVLDETMPADSTYALARNLGVAVLRPNLDPPADFTQVQSPQTGNVAGQTGILVQYEPATHGYNWSSLHGQLKYQPGGPRSGDTPFPKLDAPITINEPIYETQAQVAQILTTHLVGTPPVVQSTKAPVADFDGDGVPDSSDPYPYDPTR